MESLAPDETNHLAGANLDHASSRGHMLAGQRDRRVECDAQSDPHLGICPVGQRAFFGRWAGD